jgi:hypothetical protein
MCTCASTIRMVLLPERWLGGRLRAVAQIR